MCVSHCKFPFQIIRRCSFVWQAIQSHCWRCDPRGRICRANKWRSAEIRQGEASQRRKQIPQLFTLGSPRWISRLLNHWPPAFTERSRRRSSDSHREVPFSHTNTLQEEEEKAVHANQLPKTANDYAPNQFNRADKPC